MNNEIIVSVVMITYKHEGFIKQAIEGVLSQNINFKVELLIADDCSPDGTEEIVKEIIKSHPNGNWIRYSKHKTNLGMMANLIGVIKQSRGKYIAMCEGDDYWTDLFKLQKQINFLEYNPEYVITYHDAAVVNQNGKLIKESKTNSEDQKKDLESEELLKMKVEILTLTMCFRNIIEQFPKEFYKTQNGDAFLTVLLGQFGKGKFMDDISPSHFRFHEGGNWSGRSNSEKLYQTRKTYALVENYSQRIHNYELSNHFKKAKINSDELYLYFSIEIRDTKHFLRALSFQFLDFKHYYKPKKIIISIKTFVKYFLKL
jgi:glycosyltransferase involved in cell wall biosynthesis